MPNDRLAALADAHRLAALVATYEAARLAVLADRTPENMRACVAASAAVSAAIPPKPAPRHGSRAGMRQQAEQRARTAESALRSAIARKTL